jgi:hypothetical protein
MEKMSERTVKAHGYKSRTPWAEAIREVPSAWLEDEAKNSRSPYSLLASWKGQRCGVPAHVMISPASLQRAQDILGEIWARTAGPGDRPRIWRLVEGLLRMVSGLLGGRPG